MRQINPFLAGLFRLARSVLFHHLPFWRHTPLLIHRFAVCRRGRQSMKQTGASGLVSALSGDRFHVEDIRAREREQRRAADTNEFVEDFHQMQLTRPPRPEERLHMGRPAHRGRAPEEDMVEEFARFRPDPSLERAFDLYLHRGVASLEVAEARSLPPLPVLMQRAMRHIHAASPRLSRRQVEAKATEMLHNLNLDGCAGRPHMDWAQEMGSDQWADEMQQEVAYPMRQMQRARGGEWAEEMRMEDAYTERTWAREYEEEEFAGLDRAYESERWVDEFREDLKKREDEEDDGWFEEFLNKEKTLQVDSLKQITAKLGAIEDPKLQNSNFMSFVRGFAANNGAHPNEWANDFQRDEQRTLREQGGDWETEYGHDEAQMMDGLFEDAEFEPANWRAAPRLDGDAYECSPNNPYAEAKDPYQLGVDFFNNGRFADSVLALEAAVTRNAGDGQAWHLLGKAHQEGDKDWQAVAALQMATRCDPSNLLGLVDQAVSYTNNMQKVFFLFSFSFFL
jgi:hypothetical protein